MNSRKFSSNFPPPTQGLIEEQRLHVSKLVDDLVKETEKRLEVETDGRRRQAIHAEFEIECKEISAHFEALLNFAIRLSEKRYVK